MNPWIQQSIDCAARKGYLDDLFDVYPTNPQSRRDIVKEEWKNVVDAFESKNNEDVLDPFCRTPSLY